MNKTLLFLFLTTQIGLTTTYAQVNEEKLGGWYMYFFSADSKKSNWGVQGDIQYRNWNIVGDLEQLLLRGGVYYNPKHTDLKLTMGYGHITSGVYGSDNSTSMEHRIYQEALFPVKFGNRFYTNHRFRYEQRFVENQNFRTRYRYNLFLNIPINTPELKKNTLYLALYNEIFINGQRNIGNGNTVEIFDRNRLYVALGYLVRKNLKVQVGIMNQTSNHVGKNQFQLSLHSNF